MKSLNIVISGCFTASTLNDYGREQVRNFIVGAGYNLCSSMSKSASYLVVVLTSLRPLLLSQGVKPN